MAVTPQQTVRLSAATENGCSVYSDQDMDETKMQVKSTAGHVYSLLAINMSAVPLYLFVYFKKSSEVTVGSTIPDLTIPIPTLGNTNGSGVVWDNIYGMTTPVATGITVACTTSINGTGAPGTNACVVNLAYK